MPDDRPNVLVLLTDQQRADTIETDRCLTPNMDRLAAEGTQFSRCYATNTVCSPSRASIMTGELPHTHGMTHVEHTVPRHQAEFQSDLPTWSERLAAGGYHLAHAGKWHVERSGDLERFGFDENLAFGSDRFKDTYANYLEREGLAEPETLNRREAGGAADGEDRHTPRGSGSGPGDLDLSYVLRSRGYNDTLLYGTHDAPAAADTDYFAHVLGREYVRERADEADPWCLTVSTLAPHDAFVVPNEYYDMYDPEDIPKPESFEDSMTDKPRLYRLMQSVFDDMAWEHVAEAIACYYAYTTFVDDQIGRMLDTLEATDQLDDTVIVFASDHGDLLGSHRLFLKGAHAFEEAYRVPLVVRHPEYEGGNVREEIVQLTDLAPTICDLTGAKDIDCFGDSLVPFLRGEVPENHENEAYAEYFGQRVYWTHRVLWRDDEKYVFNGGDVDELYDLAADPYERDNLAEQPEHQDRREALLARLWNYAKETGDYTLADTHYPTVRYGHVGPGASDLDDVAEL